MEVKSEREAFTITTAVWVNSEGVKQTKSP